jgi:hypothetical protein
VPGFGKCALGDAPNIELAEKRPPPFMGAGKSQRLLSRRVAIDLLDILKFGTAVCSFLISSST